jgi:uncharacterized protein
LVRRITLLQIDPTAAIAPSADLVAWSRLSARYDRADLDRALRERELVEFRATIRPAEDLALYRAEMDAWPGLARCGTGRSTSATGCRPTTRADATSSVGCPRPAH